MLQISITDKCNKKTKNINIVYTDNFALKHYNYIMIFLIKLILRQIIVIFGILLYNSAHKNKI